MKFCKNKISRISSRRYYKNFYR